MQNINLNEYIFHREAEKEKEDTSEKLIKLLQEVSIVKLRRIKQQLKLTNIPYAHPLLLTVMQK